MSSYTAIIPGTLRAEVFHGPDDHRVTRLVFTPSERDLIGIEDADDDLDEAGDLDDPDGLFWRSVREHIFTLVCEARRRPYEGLRLEQSAVPVICWEE